MSLRVSEQRVLAGIDSALEGSEPRLRSMFAIFTRLTREDGAPHTEALRNEKLLRRLGRTVRWRAVVTVSVLAGLVALFVFAAISSSAPRWCRPGQPVTRTMSCQSASGLRGHP